MTDLSTLPPFSIIHLNISKFRLVTEKDVVFGHQGHPSSLNHFNTSNRFQLAACSHVFSSHGHPALLIHFKKWSEIKSGPTARLKCFGFHGYPCSCIHMMTSIFPDWSANSIPAGLSTPRTFNHFRISNCPSFATSWTILGISMAPWTSTKCCMTSSLPYVEAWLIKFFFVPAFKKYAFPFGIVTSQSITWVLPKKRISSLQFFHFLTS